VNFFEVAKAKQELKVYSEGACGTQPSRDSKPSPVINLHFNFQGPQLFVGIESLKLLVARLELEVEQRFEKQCSGDYQTYSYRYEQPGYDEAYTVSA
jgi:hypothetical protein